MKNMCLGFVFAATLSAVPALAQDAETRVTEVTESVVVAEVPAAAPDTHPALVPDANPVRRQKLAINLDKLAESQAAFFEEQFSKAKGESMTYLLKDLDAWLSINSDKSNSDKVLELKAKVQTELKDYKGAILTYIKHIYAYPQSNVNLTVRSQLATLVDAHVDRKLAQEVNTIAKGDNSSKKADRLAAMLEKLAGATAEFFYEPLVQEFITFSADYPDYARADELQKSLAGVFLAKNQPQTAIMAYNKLLAVYPNSALKASVRMEIASVLANNLKDYDQAIEIYQDVTNAHPGTAEAAQSYVRIGELSELRKKYALAVSVYDKIIALYPKTDSAFNAFTAKANIQRKSQSLPKEAYDTLNAQADMFKGEVRVVPVLLLAVEVAKRDLKDFKLAANALDRVATEYPNSKEAPVALLDEGEIYAEHLGNKDKAKELYERVLGSYAGNSNAKTAQKRIDTLMKL